MAVEERLAYHELLRIGLARQEDLRLLQSVVQQEPALPQPASRQLIQECQLREEWRCTREQRLQQQLRKTHLASLSDAETLRLTDQIMAMQQIQAEQRRGSLSKPTAASGRPRPASASAIPRQLDSSGPGYQAHGLAPGALTGGPASTPTSSLNAALRLYAGAGGRGSSGSRPGTSAPRPSTSQPFSTSGSSTPNTTHPARTSPSKQLVPTVRASSHFSTSPTSKRQVLTLLTPAQLRRQLSAGAANNTAVAAACDPHAPSAPPAGTQRPAPGSQGAPAVSHPDASPGQLPPRTPPRTPSSSKPLATAGAGSPAPAPVRKEPGRFHTLLRLQGTLMQGLLQHVASGGAEAAHSAMGLSVQQMQSHFNACVREVQVLLGLVAAPVAGAQAARARNWDRLLLLGQLGLTGSDMARLQLLRRQQAARVIQRAVRRWLQQRRHVAAVEAARKEAAHIALRLRSAAATIIQKFWRRWQALQLVKQLRKERLEEQRCARLRALVRMLAALRIQRGWRAHRKRVRASRALALTSHPLVDEAHTLSAAVTAAAAAGAGSSAATALRSSLDVAQPAAGMPQASQQGQPVSQITASSAATAQLRTTAATQRSTARVDVAAPGTLACVRQDAAATRIQAAFRGWRVRRGDALWWSRCKSEMRARRAAARSWAAHHAFMHATYGLQEQIVALVLQEAEAGERAMREAAAERQEFEASWGAWLRQQCTAALTQPLPKGWLPHQHPDTGEVCFLDTRSGALHAHHPAMLALRSFAATQRAAAEARLSEREQLVASHLQRLHEHNAHKQSVLLAQMQGALVQGQAETVGATGGSGTVP